MKRARRKATGYRKLLAIDKMADGRWVAIVQAFAATPDQPIIGHICPVQDLKGPQRRKADRWLRFMGATGF